MAWSLWAPAYDKRLAEAGAAMDRPEWHLEHVRKGDRHARWVAFYLVSSVLVVGIVVVVLAVAEAT
jgi:hypothetical protein